MGDGERVSRAIFSEFFPLGGKALVDQSVVFMM